MFNSCIEPIDFDMPHDLQLLVVDGKITNSGKGDYLKLSRTSKTKRVPEPVTDAIIKIVDDLGREELFIPRHDLEAGTFQHPGNIVKGQPGLTYYIEILLFDGSVYQSIPEKMPVLAAIDSLYVNYTFVKEQNSVGAFTEKKVVQLYTDTKLEPQNFPVFLKWDIEEAFQISPTDFPDPFGSIPPPYYATSIVNPQNIILFNGNLIKSQEIRGLKLATRHIDFAFKDRFYFNVEIASITMEAYNYWEKVNQVINNVGTVFDSPPAPVKGNIFNVNNKDEQVLGYFQASSVQTSRFRMLGVDIPFFIAPFCEYSEGKIDYPDICLNCLIIKNSTLERPDYF